HCVPPSGVEPEPLGLQPSAQTSYARVGSCAARPLRAQSGAVECRTIGTLDHHHRSSVVTDPADRGRRAHLGPGSDRDYRGRTSGTSRAAGTANAVMVSRDLDSESGSRMATRLMVTRTQEQTPVPEMLKGPPGDLLGGPWHSDVGYVIRGRD